MESATNDHFASRFPHHSHIEEKSSSTTGSSSTGLKKSLQPSNAVLAKVLVNNTSNLNTLSDELSRFSIKQQLPTTALPIDSENSISCSSIKSNGARATGGDKNPLTTTIPYSNVPLSTNTTTTTGTTAKATPPTTTTFHHHHHVNPQKTTNNTDNNDLQNTDPNHEDAQQSKTSTAQRNGATKKIPAPNAHHHRLHQRHLIPIKAQSIDIAATEVRIVAPSLSEEYDEDEEAAAASACDTKMVPRGSTSSEPCPSIHGMISKIKSLDTIVTRPIYPNVPYSPYGSPYSSPRAYRRTTRPPLKESRCISIEQSGSFLQLNQYKLLDQIGQGSYGLVKLAYSEEDATHYAMKILSKRKLLRRAGLMGRGPKKAISPLDRVYREIAVLKKLDHPNVVKLIEVLDDPIDDSLYLVFELVKEGEVLSIPTEQPLTEERVWCIFRDVLLGLEYLHYQRIIHGDLKPGNLLLGECGQVKIADLGVCNEFFGEDASMNNGSSGTPAFRAPETLKVGDHSYSGKGADIWALGATLYALVYGNVPFVAGNIPALYEKIKNDPIHFPPTSAQHSPELKELILRMLEKDPDQRISLNEIKEDNWVTANQNYPMPSEEENCRLIQVTDEELSCVVTSIPKLDTLILIKTMLKKHSFQNPFQKPLARTSQRGVTRLERFRAGRSNSAPGAYLQKQFSTETCLPSVIEGCVSEGFNKEEEPIPEDLNQG